MSKPTELWRRAILPPTGTIRHAVSNLNEVAIQIVLVVNELGQLEGTVSDGDIRRGLLKNLNLESPFSSIVNRNPLVVPEGIESHLVMQLMAANKVRQIPIVDQENKLIGLHLWDEFTNSAERANMMVIMAGGKGTRLRPQTDDCPKPMLPVAGKPMLEHIIERAKQEGIREFVIAIHYLAHVVEDYFGNGASWGVSITYLREPTPLGTAGALSLLNRRPDVPIVVANGDVIADIRYGDLLDFHGRHSAAATMAVRIHEWQNPFGVVQMNGLEIVGFDEKPIIRSHINAGVYALEPSALDALGKGEYCAMPTLFENLQGRGQRIVAYPMHERWLDVGRPDDLARAAESLPSQQGRTTT
jgi:dTDP-glucose pyrophosphorylase